MAVRQIKFNDTFIYVNDEIYDADVIAIMDKKDLEENTKVIEVVSEDGVNDNTSINIFEEKNE